MARVAKTFVQPLSVESRGREKGMASCAWSVLGAIFIFAAFRVFRPVSGLFYAGLIPTRRR